MYDKKSEIASYVNANVKISHKISTREGTIMLEE